MGTLRTRTVGGTVLLALLLVLSGCSGGAEREPAATPTPTGTLNATPTETGANVTSAGGGSANESGVEADERIGDDWDRYYVFNESEAYGYAVDLGNGTTAMSWAVTSTADDTPGLYEDVTANVTFGQYSSAATASQADVFAALISEGSVGEPFLYVRTPVVLAAGHNLSVGNSWTIQGSDVAVGDGFEVTWDEARAEITGTARVAGETCYTMDLRIPGNETGPTSCVKYDWPFALAVDTAEQDYRLADFQRP
ncbi:hypothetical protein [Halorientalis pallida]|uniref:Lipoprotein n=1 Tax=Halorientalis pallida TaxID=2479928 RepID=A0A498KX38_9EURY|nr:hypothetical protein [Halorientalis pallida]RXK49506.1 hypothetical protein EAF64_11410 [Halorientalis pallida]